MVDYFPRIIQRRYSNGRSCVGGRCRIGCGGSVDQGAGLGFRSGRVLQECLIVVEMG
jgi:hypothetical protein